MCRAETHAELPRSPMLYLLRPQGQCKTSCKAGSADSPQSAHRWPDWLVVRAVREVLPGVPSYDRTTINAWEDADFVQAVRANGRKKLIMGAHTSVPALRAGAGVAGGQASARVGVRGLPSPDVGDRGHGSAQDAYAAASVVLGGQFDEHPDAWRVGLATAAPARAQQVRDGVDDAAQVAPGHGQPRTPTSDRGGGG